MTKKELIEKIKRYTHKEHGEKLYVTPKTLISWVSKLEPTIRNIEYEYCPKMDTLYEYDGKKVLVEYCFGYTVLFDLEGNFVDSFEEYSKEEEKLKEIGVHETPRWKKYHYEKKWSYVDKKDIE